MAPRIPAPGTRRKWVVNCTLQPLFSGKNPVPVENEAGWAPERVWTVLKGVNTLRELCFDSCKTDRNCSTERGLK